MDADRISSGRAETCAPPPEDGTVNDTSSGDRDLPDVEAIRAICSERSLTIDDLGGEGGRVDLVSSLADTDVLTPVTSMLVDWFATEGRNGQPELCGALVDAITSTTSPAVFGDTIAQICSSPEVLAQHGDDLAKRLVEQAALAITAQPRAGLRAAQALEAVTRLEVATPTGARWRLLVLLSEVEPTAPLPYQRACIRSIVAMVEATRDADTLVGALRRLAALDPSQKAAADCDPMIESDVAVALARMSILRALRADEDETVGHLDQALRHLAAVLDTDERVDAIITAAIATIMRSLLAGEPIPNGTIDSLADAVREHRHHAAGVGHWITDRVAATNVAWAKLAVDLRTVDAEFARDSWYEAAKVLDGIIDLYRTSRSQALFERESDGKTVRSMIAPIVEGGFADKASLLRHLDDHIDALQSKVDDNTATEQQAADLTVAVKLQTEARTTSGPLLKPGAGGTQYLSGTGGSPADPADRDRVLANVYTQQLISRASTGSIVGDELLEAIRKGFAASPDWDEHLVRESADVVAHHLVCFLLSRDRLGESQVPYLFLGDVDEKTLAADLYDYLLLSGAVGNVRVEVPLVAGGRVDIEFACPGFNLYVELKVDSTKKPLADKMSYLRQTVAYQSQGKRVGFLVVLKLYSKKVVPPVVMDRVEMVNVSDGTPEGRHVAAFTIVGNKTKPSDY